MLGSSLVCLYGWPTYVCMYGVVSRIVLQLVPVVNPDKIVIIFPLWFLLLLFCCFVLVYVLLLWKRRRRGQATSTQFTQFIRPSICRRCLKCFVGSVRQQSMRNGAILDFGDFSDYPLQPVDVSNYLRLRGRSSIPLALPECGYVCLRSEG